LDNPLRQADGGALRAGNVLWHPLEVHQAWLAGKIARGRLERVTVRFQDPLPHDRNVWVHVPAGYEGRTKGLPALYLLHGGGGSGLAYCTGDVAPELSDTLLALGRVRPFVTVMPDLDPPAGTREEMKNPFGVDADKWVVELQGQIQKSALDVRENLVLAIEKRYGLRADWSGRTFLGNSGGGYHCLLIEADSKVPYAKVLAPSAMFNPRLNEYFFAALDRRGKAEPRPRLIAAAGENDPMSKTTAAQNLGTIAGHCRAFAQMAEERGLLQRKFIHNFGHSGGPEILVETMEAAYGKAK
jgi:enterochelin esterase-like enzyme